MKNLMLLEAVTWISVYENENDNGTETENKGENKGASENKTGTSGNPGEEDDKPKFSQKQLNAMLAENKRNLKSTVDKQVSELETLKKSKNLSDRERETLSTRIEELQNSLLSKQELANKEKEQMERSHKVKLDETTGQRDYFKTLFERTTIENEITKEAVKAEAFSPMQIITLLKGSTRLVEALDETGTVVPEKYGVKVRLDDTDKDGKPVTLELSVPEALKRMKERPDDFGNLFKANINGGLGASGGKAGKTADPKNMTPEQYMKWRKERGF